MLRVITERDRAGYSRLSLQCVIHTHVVVCWPLEGTASSKGPNVLMPPGLALVLVRFDGARTAVVWESCCLRDCDGKQAVMWARVPGADLGHTAVPALHHSLVLGGQMERQEIPLHIQATI